MDKDGLYPFRTTGERLPPHLEKKLEIGEASSSIMESLFYSYYDQRKYRLGRETLLSSFSTYYMQHRHPLKQDIDTLLGQMTDSGIMLHIKDRHLWTEGTAARDFERLHNEEDEERLVKITTSHLSALWILFTMGTVMGMCAFALEFSKTKHFSRLEHLQL